MGEDTHVSNMGGSVYTIAGGKGGVGKTTTTVNLAVALSQEGHNVVAVEADLGMTNLGQALDVESDVGVHQVLAGEAAVAEAVVDGPEGVSVIPGDRSLEAFADADPSMLGKVIDTLAVAYDVVLVDTGAGLSHETLVPMGRADRVVLVTSGRAVSMDDTDKTAALAEQVGSAPVGAIVTKVREDEDPADSLDVDVLGTIPRVPDALDASPLVTDARDSEAAAAYRDLAEILAADHVAREEGDVAEAPADD